MTKSAHLSRIVGALTISYVACRGVQPSANRLDVSLLSKPSEATLPGLPRVPLSACDEDLIIAIHEQGTVDINSQVVARDSLEDQLRTILSSRRCRSVWLTADTRVRYGDVVPLIDQAKGAGATQVLILQDQRHLTK